MTNAKPLLVFGVIATNVGAASMFICALTCFSLPSLLKAGLHIAVAGFIALLVGLPWFMFATRRRDRILVNSQESMT